MTAGRTPIRTAAVVVTTLGALLLGAGLNAGAGWAPRTGHSDLRELRVPVSAAAWVSADQPDEPPDPATGLRAGDTHGGAVTYLKVDVPERGTHQGGELERGLLRLTGTGAPLPGLVELVTVPDTGWEPDHLTWAGAPVLGPAVQSVQPADGDDQVVFDITDQVAARPGVHAFAVTVPPDHGHATFVGPSAGPSAGPGAPVLQLSWADTGTTPSPGTTPLPGTPVPTLSAVPADPEDAVAPRVPPAPGPPEPTASPAPPECVVQELLVPSCGVLWGVAPDGHTGSPRTLALTEFERVTGRRQDIYHAYHRGQALFPTEEEVAIAAGGRILFLNWKPREWSWAEIAAGHPTADAYLDRLAEHINTTFSDPFFLTIHHEPENNVRPSPGSGFQAADYAAMFRYVVQRLRDRGVDNMVTVMNHMAYVPWNVRPWFPELYPGDDVVDWLAWNSYAYSDPGYGHGDFAEMMNRRSSQYPDWPGFYTWATERFPDKPFMLAEWGVWHSHSNPGHMAEFYDSAARQTPLFPRVKAMVYFDTPSDQRARDSRPTAAGSGLEAYRRLGEQPYFQVRLDPAEQ